MKNIQEFQKLCQDGVINTNGSVQFESAHNYIRSMDGAILYSDKLLYLETLKRTQENNVLEALINNGLLNIFSQWLNCAINPLMHQCATIIMKILTMVPVNVNSQGLNEVVKSLKRYRNIESTSNCPEKECEEVKKYANHTVKVLKNNCDSKDIRRKENKAAKKLLKPNNGLSTKEPVSENIKKVNAAPKRCLIETPANSESKKASNSKPPPPKKNKKSALSDSSFLDDIIRGQKAAMPKQKRPAKKPVSVKQPSSKPDKQKITATSTDENLDDAVSANDETEKEKVKMPTYGKNGKLKKVLRWADNSGIDLEEIRYFEVMPGERVNVNNENFKEALEKERQRERLRQGDVDGNVWVRPGRIIVNDEFGKAMENWGQLSVEKDTQIRRESSTLMAIYLTPQMIPDSPAEPEPEKIDFVEPKVIPYLNKDSNVSSNINNTPPENRNIETSNKAPLLEPTNGNIPVVADNMPPRHQQLPRPNTMRGPHIPHRQYQQQRYMLRPHFMPNRHPGMNGPPLAPPHMHGMMRHRHMRPRQMFRPHGQQRPLRRSR